MAWGGPYVQTSWVNGTTPLSQTNMNHLESQYSLATTTLEQDLFNPYVLYGLVCSADTTTLNQLDVTAGVAFLIQTDSTVARQALAASTASQFLTSTINTTYYLDLNPNGTWSFATSHSGTANYLPICQCTTNASGNISGVTDMRNLNALAFPAGASFGVNSLKLQQSTNSALIGGIAGTVVYGQTGPVVGDTAALFNGTNAEITTPTTGLPSGNGTWSIEGWCKFAANPASAAMIGCFGTLVSHEEGMLYIDSSGIPRADTFGGATTGGAAVSTGAWHHIVGTWDGTNLRIYSDGAVNGTAATPGSMTIPASPTICAVGGQSGAINLFPGSLYGVAFYNTTLSLARISAHFTAASSGSAAYIAAVLADSPLRFYRLADVPGSTAALDTILSAPVTILDTAGNMTVPSNLYFSQGGQILFDNSAPALQIGSRQSGALNGVYFFVWTGLNGTIPFSVGGQFGGAPTYIANTGVIGAVAGQATAGSFGVPVIVAQAFNTLVNVHTEVIICTFTAPATGLYRASCWFTNINTGASTLTAKVFYTDPNTSAGTGQVFQAQTGYLNALAASSTTGTSYALSPITVYCASGQTVSVRFTDSTNTNTDRVSGMIERLS